MSGKTKSLGKQSAIYGAGIVLGKLASFIMLPVYTRYLTPADYGVLELLSMTIDVIGMIAGIGIGSAVFKFYADEADEAGKREVQLGGQQAVPLGRRGCHRRGRGRLCHGSSHARVQTTGALRSRSL